MGRRSQIAIVLLTVLAGVTVWYGWRRYSAPVPPEIACTGLDPEVADAIETARRKIHADPYSAPSWGHLGKLLRAAQLYPEAAACFAQAGRLEPKNPCWPYLQGEALRSRANGAEAVPPLQRAVALADSTGTLAPFLRLAEVLLALGRNDEAEKPLRHALEIEPDNPAVHYNLGLLALEHGDLSGSLAHLKRCEHSPFTQRKACIQLAAVYRRMGQTEKADHYSRKADTLPPDSNWLDPFLADVRAVGRPARLEEIHRLEKRGDYRAAVEQLAALIQDKPDERLYIALGKDLYKLGDLDRAEQALRSALALTSDDNVRAAAVHQLGRVLLTRADKDAHHNPQQARAEFEQAAACARQVLASRPDHAMSYVVLGLALRRLDKRPEALEALRTAVQCDPNSADAHFYLGETLAEAGQIPAARASLERAQECNPNDPRPRTALAKLKD